MRRIDNTHTTTLREQFAQNLRSVYRKAQIDIIELFKQGKLAPADIDDILNSPILHEIILKRFSDAFQRGDTFANTQVLRMLGQRIMPTNIIVMPENFAKVHKYTEDLVEHLNSEQKRRILTTIQRGIFNHETRNEITKKIRDGFNVANNRATKIARTEIIRTFNHAAESRYSQLGVKEARIVITDDERTCDECRKKEGDIVQLGKDALPPFHTNCRCTIVPVLKYGKK